MCRNLLRSWGSASTMKLCPLRGWLLMTWQRKRKKKLKCASSLNIYWRMYTISLNSFSLSSHTIVSGALATVLAHVSSYFSYFFVMMSQNLVATLLRTQCVWTYKFLILFQFIFMGGYISYYLMPPNKNEGKRMNRWAAVTVWPVYDCALARMPLTVQGTCISFSLRDCPGARRINARCHGHFAWPDNISYKRKRNVGT